MTGISSAAASGANYRLRGSPPGPDHGHLGLLHRLRRRGAVWAGRTLLPAVDAAPPLLVGLLVAAPQLTGSLLRIPFGAWVDKVGGRLPMLTLFGLSIVGMWGLVFILVTARRHRRRCIRSSCCSAS